MGGKALHVIQLVTSGFQTTLLCLSQSLLRHFFTRADISDSKFNLDQTGKLDA